MRIRRFVNNSWITVFAFHTWSWAMGIIYGLAWNFYGYNHHTVYPLPPLTYNYYYRYYDNTIDDYRISKRTSVPSLGRGDEAPVTGTDCSLPIWREVWICTRIYILIMQVYLCICADTYLYLFIRLYLLIYTCIHRLHYTHAKRLGFTFNNASEGNDM
jgi:hypothetical protein